jgi:hypothetical protein
MPVFASRTFPNTFNLDNNSELAYRWYTVRYGNPLSPLGRTNGSFVGYRTVTESVVNNGKTVLTFSMPATWHIENDIPIPTAGGVCDPLVDGHCDGLYQLSAVKDIFISTVASELVTSNYDMTQTPAAPNTFPFPDNPNYDWQRGHLLSEKIYDNTNNLLKETKFTYRNYFPDNRTSPATVFLNSTGFLANAYAFRISKYNMLTEVAKVLESKKEIIYNTADLTKKLTSEVVLQYESTKHKEPTSISSTGSDGRAIKTIRKFPEDFSANELGSNLLVTKHIHGVPLQQIDLTGGVQTGKKETTYQLSNNKIVPGTIANYRDGSNAPDKVTLEYDDVGNLQQSTPIHDETPDGLVKFKGNPMSYVWGYNKTLPIAKAENALAKDVCFTSFEDDEGTSAIDDSRTGHKSRMTGYVKTLTNLSDGPYTLTYWKKTGSEWILEIIPVDVTGGNYTINIATSLQIDDLRFHPSNARMLTYTYDPLVGMTSMTDENNLTTFFEFDNNNRLKFIKDFEKKILKQHLYHFKGQP